MRRAACTFPPSPPRCRLSWPHRLSKRSAASTPTRVHISLLLVRGTAGPTLNARPAFFGGLSFVCWLLPFHSILQSGGYNRRWVGWCTSHASALGSTIGGTCAALPTKSAACVPSGRLRAPLSLVTPSRCGYARAGSHWKLIQLPAGACACADDALPFEGPGALLRCRL